MIGAILFVAGSLFSAAAPNVEILLVSRVLLGLAVGVASYTGSAVSIGNRARKNSRQYDFHVPADDHHRDPWRLSL
ncbi:Arabinose-proton symporter [Klebsiella pneumoniae]|uniref:Arabinose-proton symporter n=1 Tax=Klebsiella pneumoniae TaxID=573 RepID=A0A377U4X6_KLEPN|nr:Arabinose-proton symporter [Klebsiella pneumoniae]